MVSKTKAKRSIYIYNGIDRVDNSLGYVKENCKSCCFRCNKIKRDMSLEEFEQFLIKAYENVVLKEVEII